MVAQTPRWRGSVAELGLARRSPALTLIVCFFLQACGTNSTTKLTTSSLTVTTTSLPNGIVGTVYSGTLKGSGGTTPYSWTLTAGTLPAGLSLSSSGVISGTPTAAANATSLTFKVTDSSQPAETNSATLSLTIKSAAPTITTTSLPNGNVGAVYKSSLAASGGTPPYTWTLTAGTLPSGLILSASGAISGTPTTATANAASLTFKVTDSSQPAQTNSATLSLTIASAVSVSVSPMRAGLTITQTLSLTGKASDGGAVNWSAAGSSCSGTACGTFSAQKTASGSPVTYTAPGTAGQYTITATSVNDSAGASSVTVGVTDLAGVPTYHNNVARNGVNSQEYTLAPSNVTASTFGKLFSCTADGAIYAQPLWVPNLTIGGAKHNVVLVATQHDSLYAFDADASPCVTLWHANLIDTSHGGTAGETSVPYLLVGQGDGDIQPEIGVTGTPVIDLGTDLLYVVSKSVDSTGTNFYQRLHAINLLTGNENLSTGSVVISATFPAIGTTATFSAKQENQRAGLALINGVVYIAWGSHEDTDPFYGWMIGYDPATLSQRYVLNTAPNTGETSIWMGGGAPAADSSGNIYVITANGNFDVTNTAAPNNDYGDSFLKLTNNLTVLQYFTPADQSTDNSIDNDFGSGGAAVVVDLPANGTYPNHLVIGGGKDGYLCLLNRDSLGGYSATNSGAVQLLNLGAGIYGTPAYWNWSFYLAGMSGHLQQYTLSSSTYKINPSPTSASATIYGFPGASPSITTKPDNSNAILWALDNTQYCTLESPGCGPAILHAYDATNLATEFWNSSQGTGNTAGFPVKFTFPTVANGKVYIGTRGNDSQQPGNTATIPGELDVYGLLPN
ncbi:MAG: putative Ig domain-containing protein [Terracidiphilus sp.]